MADADDYLQEGFDPRSVTMPRLRSILVTHNVEYPATAKKGQLVELVTEHVLSQAPKLRAQKARAKRSSMGIVNAGSAEDVSTWGDDQDLLPPPPSTTRRSRSPRKASAPRVKVERDETATPAPRSPTKRSARSTSRQLPHVEDHDVLDFEAPKSTRRSRKTTPQIKAEPEEEPALPPAPQEESVFTYDNPFQGGSSPQPYKTPTNRRRTAGGDGFESARSTSRRRTGDYGEDRIFDAETPNVLPRTPQFALDAGEEFTPDEQLELEEAASRGEATLEVQKSTTQVARRSSAKAPLFVLLMSLLGAYLAWYRQEKIAVGYCGLGRPAKELLPPEVPVPDFLVLFIEPQCESCPQHAYCYEDFSVRCEPDFILQAHPLSLGGIVPLPPSCEPDGEKARRVKAVADKAVEELRERRAKYECGELVDEGQKGDSPTIPEQELKETVSRKRSKRLNKDEFDDLWAAAIGEVTAREEVEVVEPTQ